MPANNPSIADLRVHLFKQLDQLNDISKPADIQRARAVSEVAQTIINSLKVEVDFLAIVNGAADVPFIEDQGARLPADTAPAQRAAPLTAIEQATNVLTAGPSDEHPWRKNGRKRA